MQRCGSTIFKRKLCRQLQVKSDGLASVTLLIFDCFVTDHGARIQRFSRKVS